MHERSPNITRRKVLSLGAATLLAGCTAPDHKHATFGAPPSGSGPNPSPSPSDSPSPAPSPSPSPSASVPAVAAPQPGVCRPVPGLVQRPGGPQYYLPCHGTDIALTIDDGPDPTWTPRVLDLLAQYRIRATFCMVGKRAAANPRIVAAVAAAGHQIANHTFTHPLTLPTLSERQIVAEMNQTDDVLGAATGHRPTLFRAPGGNWSPTVLEVCAQRGMRPLGWSVDPRDWSLPGIPHIVDTILTRTSPGAIILDHDGGGDRSQTVAALRIALPRLQAAGYHFTQP